jgi:hypothetical protein
MLEIGQIHKWTNKDSLIGYSQLCERTQKKSTFKIRIKYTEFNTENTNTTRENILNFTEITEL